MTEEPILIICDADEICFQACAGAEQEHRWDDSIWTYTMDEEAAFAACLSKIDGLVNELNAADVVVCFTAPDNFRKKVLPTYKSNRAGARRPLGLQAVKDRLQAHYGDKAFVRPGLEADDCMGILATAPNYKRGFKKVICSFDKDMKTIPGRLYKTNERKRYSITEEEADRWFYAQTIAGDATDGFSGAPGVGLVTAMKLLEAGEKLEPYDHVLTRGPRKGTVERRWRNVPAANGWETVVSVYESVGLNEEAALAQARCARILRASDYDFEKKEVILWQP